MAIFPSININTIYTYDCGENYEQILEIFPKLENVDNIIKTLIKTILFLKKFV